MHDSPPSRLQPHPVSPGVSRPLRTDLLRACLPLAFLLLIPLEPLLAGFAILPFNPGAPWSMVLLLTVGPALGLAWAALLHESRSRQFTTPGRPNLLLGVACTATLLTSAATFVATDAAGHGDLLGITLLLAPGAILNAILLHGIFRSLPGPQAAGMAFAAYSTVVLLTFLAVVAPSASATLSHPAIESLRVTAPSAIVALVVLTRLALWHCSLPTPPGIRR